MLIDDITDRSDDGDGNEKVKKKQNENSECAARFFKINFFDVTARLRRFMEDVNKPRRNFILFLNLDIALTNSNQFKISPLFDKVGGFE